MAGVHHVTIRDQVRERGGVTYHLNCGPTGLVVRVFPLDNQQWRIEASTTDPVDAVVAIASAPTSQGAVHDVAKWWREKADLLELPSIDWEAVARAMADGQAP